MATRLRELIKRVRACKTAAEERAVVAKESAEIRSSFAAEENDYRHRNISKLLFIQMLGYPTHFGQIDCMKLIVSSQYADKRIGYLGMMLLLDERQEVLTLSTNSMKTDLTHPNQYIVGLSLCALANISSAEICRDVASDIEKLLQTSNPYVRKKAALTAIRVVRKVPELAENFVPRVRSMLSEKNHGVLITALALAIELCGVDGANIAAFKRLVPTVVRVLKSLVLSGYAPEYDVAGVTDPFLQVKCLKLLRLLGKGDREASESMNDILAQVATNTESLRNVGNAILYECVLTIMEIESESGLRVLAINILGRFLLNRDNNIRYVALNTLTKVVAIDTAAVQRHRNTIVDCLKDNDVSIRKRALDLIYALVNENNVKILVREMLNFLEVSDAEFRADLTAKICIVVDKFAPSKRWQVDNLIKVMSIAGQHIADEHVSGLIALVGHTPELQSYAAQKLYLALQKDLLQQALVQVGVWCLGEYGNFATGGGGGGGGGGLLDAGGDASASAAASSEQAAITEKNVIDLLEQIVKYPGTSDVTRQFVLNALVKLSERWSSNGAACERIAQVLALFSSSLNVELQQRACEYQILASIPPATRAKVLELLPPMEVRKEQAAEVVSGGGGGGVAAGGAIAGPTSMGMPAAPSATPAVGGLDDMFGDMPGSTLGGGAALGTGLSPSPAAVEPAMPSPMLMPSSEPLMPTSSSGASSSSSSSASASPALADTPAGGAPSGVVGASGVPQLTAFSKGGLVLTFDFVRQANNPAVVGINMVFSNTNSTPITSLTFQAAVPNYIKMQMLSPSGNTLTPMGAGRITQRLNLNNTLHGQRPLQIKGKLDYTITGKPVSEVFAVTNFPAELSQ